MRASGASSSAVSSARSTKSAKSTCRCMSPNFSSATTTASMTTFSARRLRDVDFMSGPTHKTGKKGHPNPNKSQTSHSSQAMTEKKTTPYKFLRNFGASLHQMPGWLWRKKGDLVVWASVAMTLCAGAFYFLPRVTVDPSGPYDPANPSPITFTIANINIVPLQDVQPTIGLCYIVIRDSTGSKPPECNGPSLSRLAFTPWRIKWLDVDEKYQIAIEEAIKIHDREQIEVANITIAIVYRPWYMPFRLTKEFRFITKPRSDGKIYWIPTPLNR
jgi:hypothetical protein